MCEGKEHLTALFEFSAYQFRFSCYQAVAIISLVNICSSLSVRFQRCMTSLRYHGNMIGSTKDHK